MNHTSCEPEFSSTLRWECYRYSPRRGSWRRATNLPFEYGAVSYPASAAGDRANMYIVGGRRYEGNYTIEPAAKSLVEKKEKDLKQFESPTVLALVVNVVMFFLHLITYYFDAGTITLLAIGTFSRGDTGSMPGPGDGGGYQTLTGLQVSLVN